MKNKDNLSFVDIDDEFILKKSYNNISGLMKENVGKQQDVKYWIDVFRYILDMVNKGEDINDVKNKVMEDWTPMDKEKFDAWMKYYLKKEHEKYASIFDTNVENSQLEVQHKKEKTQEDLKKTLIGRLNSAERLLYQFVDVWPSDIFNRLYRGLSDLKGEIMLMRTAATLTDRIVRLANVWEREGFVEGASELKKIAEPDLASQISDALSGKLKSNKTDIAAPEGVDEPLPDVAPMDTQPGEKFNIEDSPPGGDLPPMEDLPPMGDLPPMEDLSKLDESNKNDITEQEKFEVEDLPPKEEVKDDEQKSETGDKAKFDVLENDNPFAGASVQDVLNILEPLAQSLRERNFSLKLSKADMMLDAMNVASHFPEIGEISQKALEFNIYANTRLEKVISKLKGGLKEDDASISDNKSPKIEMDELHNKLPKKDETQSKLSEEDKILDMLK